MNSQNTRLGSWEQLKLPNVEPRTIGLIVLGVIVLVLLWSSFFTVEPEEVGLVLTFGKYGHQVEPGLRFKLPYPIQTVIKVPIQRQLKQEFGFRTQRLRRRSVDAHRRSQRRRGRVDHAVPGRRRLQVRLQGAQPGRDLP
jgi:membrane protease subunit HflK